MTYKEVADMIHGIGIPCAYRSFPEGNSPNPPSFPEGNSPNPPFICFYYDGADDLKADNTNYVKIRPLTIELYTDNKDFDLEDVVEAALNSSGLVYSKDETYIESERMYMVVYETEIIITEENNG